MGKIILKADDAINLAAKLSNLPYLEISDANEMVDSFLNRVETVRRFNKVASRIRVGMKIGMEAQGVEVDEETLTWICVLLEKEGGEEW